jgi:(4S)-4-hydroxy-5-phosphonooxypentane-2,3-dione isomerase
MVVLTVIWVAKTGHENDMVSTFAKLTEESRKEPGCIMYLVHRHKTDPRRFFIYEQYKDDAALEAHRASPHFLQYAKKELPKLGERIEGNLYSPIE